jgi:uncharacterized membrane protein YesL
MRKLTGITSLSLATLLMPALAAAQGLFGTLSMINRFLNGLIGIIITIAIIVFFWGLVQYLTNVGEEKHKGLIMIFYALIAIFVMVSIWGIIRLLQLTFGVGGTGAILPDVVPSNYYNNR